MYVGKSAKTKPVFSPRNNSNIDPLSIRQGSFVYLQYSNSPSVAHNPYGSMKWKQLSSPPLMSKDVPWRCVRFWVHLATSYSGKTGELGVYLEFSEGDRKQVWAISDETEGWAYVQLPLVVHQTKV